jgi:hypothetical protein
MVQYPRLGATSSSTELNSAMGPSPSDRDDRVRGGRMRSKSLT